VHGDVGPLIEQRMHQLFDKNAVSTDGNQTAVDLGIAFGRDGDDLHVDRAIRLQHIDDELRLRHGKCTAASCDSQHATLRARCSSLHGG